MDNKLRAEVQDKRSVIEKFTRDLRGRDDRIKKLEGSITEKDTEINTLKHGIRERNEDVNTLVPEVARLQQLNAEMKSVNDSRMKEFTALKAEAERLKLEFEKGNKENLATVQQLTAKLESEQSKHSEFIKKLEQTAKDKADEINSLQTNLSDKTKKISDLEKKLGSLDKMSTDLASLEEYRATTEKSIAESRRTIQSLQSDLANEKADAEKKAARIKELERLQESMFGKDGEIQRLKKVCVLMIICALPYFVPPLTIVDVDA
jgi:chromosome segregation ATPase